jgi:DNA-binding transcriptional LysR family regulator
MELRQLRYFLAVARTMNFTRAAEEMHIAQPPLSRQISHLEDELGVRLIDRDARPMRLTSSGEFFRERAQEIVSRVERLKKETVTHGRSGRQILRIGFETSALYGHLPAVVKYLRSRNPHLDIDLRQLSARDQVEAIRTGVAEIGVGRELIPDDAVEQRVVRQEPYLVALPVGHPLAGEDHPALRFADLECENIIVYGELGAIRRSDLVSRLMDQAGFVPMRKTDIGDLLAALGLVAAEAGISIVPASARRMRTDDVCYKLLDEEGAISSIVVSLPKGWDSPIPAQICDALRRLAGLNPGEAIAAE